MFIGSLVDWRREPCLTTRNMHQRLAYQTIIELGKDMKQVRWGILGPGNIAQNFADGLAQAPSGLLTAIASTSSERRASFGDLNNVEPNKRYANYESLLADADVDAIYIATPHPWHAQWAIKAMRAGKAVLVEKPAGMNAAEVVATTEVAEQCGTFFMEAFMYRCHPQISRMLEIMGSGEIGTLRHIKTTFGFSSKVDPASRLYDRKLGGGGILDVGGYPVSLVRLVAGAAAGKPFADPQSVKGTGNIGQTGVDEVAYGLLTFAGGFTAEIACSVIRTMDNNAVIYGDKGTIELVDPWVPGRNAGPSDATIIVTVAGTSRTEEIANPNMLFSFEAEIASRAIALGLSQAPYPAMSWADSIGNNTVLDRWRGELGYATFTEDPKLNRATANVLPNGLPQIPKIKIADLATPISQLVIGCDNRDDIASGALVWDAWMEAGGNAFDTGFVYGGGNHEKVLGQWIANRGVAKDVITIVKGAHTPYCTPRAIEAQLNISLERLGLNHAPIYMMHRDNVAVPVGEFVDALNVLHQAGRIGAFGGSNWSVARLKEANAYAAKHGLKPLTILNNNLSLAVMEKPVWDGCITSNTPETLSFLRQSNTTHISWSSQARGYFLPEPLRSRLPADTSPETCFGSTANAERRARAESLAKQHGVSPHNIATAWVLAQTFPSLALIGPRSPGEIASTLPGLGVKLSAAEVAWLNLESAGG
jgi:predicted dehydrogenase/aryl-alcohol dehydrogenase-like predicted oxidoreductase